MDSPAVRPEPWRSRGGFAIPEVERDGHAQAVVDVRRAVDLLVARPDVDPKRLAYVAHSYGARSAERLRPRKGASKRWF